MHLKLFPLELSGQESIICFNTTIVEPGTSNGHESRNANWQNPLLKYNLKFCVKSKADANLLQAFFISVKGRETAFLVKDRLDFNGRLYFAESPDDARTEFQIVKRYTDILGNTYERPITKPIASTAHLYRLDPGEIEYAPSEFSANESTGKLTFLTPPPPTGLELYIDIEFNVPIRFGIDELPANLDQYWVDDNDNEIAHVYFPDIPAQEVRNE